MATSPVFRPTARLILLGPDGRALLFCARDPRVTFWFTPGGGVHRGETLTGAAARELAELGPIVATCAGLWTSDDGRLLDLLARGEAPAAPVRLPWRNWEID